MGDDYQDAIPFILQFSSDSTLVEKINQFLSPYNDHRIVTNRILYATIYAITGEINFYTLTMIGNINILALIVCYYREIRFTPERLVTLAIICSLLFQIACTRAALWPITVISNYSVITFSFLSLIFLNCKYWWGLPLAIIFAAFSTFTLASGQLVFFAGLALLLTNILDRKTSLLDRKNIIWLAAGLLILVVFYSGMPTKRLEAVITLNGTLSNQHNYIWAFFKLVGSPFAYGNHLLAGTIGICGVIILLTVAILGAWKQHVLLAFSLFLLASLAVIALTRSWGGHDYLIVYADRYRFIAFNYWICMIILTLKVLSEQALKISATLLLLTFLLCIYTYEIRTPIIKEVYHRKENGMQIWQETGDARYLSYPQGSNPKKVLMDLQTIIDEGKYTPLTLPVIAIAKDISDERPFCNQDSCFVTEKH
ncbi:hypothetical protein [Oceanicoccus sp. KOV_DT_Chl]|uniref:hypothetical protein n=1 Tax=Oceanicoccus sp. KOV_DT_Chl TaxID=1904639 RepID=UPI0011AF10B1|nr:hypothetical protein [Oceanicoccus sp. KOV_DT_Chl]